MPDCGDTAGMQGRGIKAGCRQAGHKLGQAADMGRRIRQIPCDKALHQRIGPERVEAGGRHRRDQVGITGIGGWVLTGSSLVATKVESTSSMASTRPSRQPLEVNETAVDQLLVMAGSAGQVIGAKTGKPVFRKKLLRRAQDCGAGFVAVSETLCGGIGWV